VYYAFDVLYLDGRDLLSEPLTKRRARLPAILGGDATLRLSQELLGTAREVVDAVSAAGLEDVIAKRKDSVYQPGERSSDWVRLKLERQQVRGTCDCRVRILAAALKSFCRVRGRLISLSSAYGPWLLRRVGTPASGVRLTGPRTHKADACSVRSCGVKLRLEPVEKSIKFPDRRSGYSELAKSS
jgi:hypothetical protein